MNKYRNNIIVTNIDQVLEYKSQLSYYKSAFEILYELDNKVKFLENFNKTYLIQYKNGGFFEFQLENVIKQKNKNLLIFTYMGAVS